MAKMYHLTKDFGLYKKTIQANFDDNDRGPEHDDVRKLLARRGNFYTANELHTLSMFFLTSHDECVLDFPEEYSPLEVAAKKRKVAKVEWAINHLEKILTKDGVI